MKTLSDLEKEKQELREKLKSIDEEIGKIKSKTLVRCEDTFQGKGCKQGYEIGELTYIQTHYYVEPQGCCDGDYWMRGEGQWDCPNCGHRNRLYLRPEIMEMKALFKEVVDEYKD